jgi:SAM-dependent methyltransferase
MNAGHRPQGTANRPRYAEGIDSLFSGVVSVTGVVVFPGICNICRCPTLFVVTDANLRENVICLFCKSFNRARQMYRVFSLDKRSGDIRIWNMEHSGSLHRALLRTYGGSYISSAYLGKDIASGTFVQGIRHEDVLRTSFPSDHLDVILSSDVLEHVPKPEAAFVEISRILKPGGAFIFTVPFQEDQEQSDLRARESELGEIVYLKEPLYHNDPLRPEGILVFTIFGWDMLKMTRAAGLECSVHRPYSLRHGMIGPGTLVFTAVKPIASSGTTS